MGLLDDVNEAEGLGGSFKLGSSESGTAGQLPLTFA